MPKLVCRKSVYRYRYRKQPVSTPDEATAVTSVIQKREIQISDKNEMLH